MKLTNLVKVGVGGVFLGAILGVPGVLVVGLIVAPQIALIQHMYKGIEMDKDRINKKE